MYILNPQHVILVINPYTITSGFNASRPKAKGKIVIPNIACPMSEAISDIFSSFCLERENIIVVCLI